MFSVILYVQFLFTSVQKERRCPLVDTTLNQGVFILFHCDKLLENFLQRMTQHKHTNNIFLFIILKGFAGIWMNSNISRCTQTWICS